MKRILLLMITFIILFSTSAVFAVGNSIDGKIGSSYSMGPEKMGLDIELDYFYELDPFFIVGISGNLYWLQWSQELSAEEVSGNLNTKPEETFNAFMFPIMGIAQVRLVNFKESTGITPYLGGGLGYSTMSYSYYNGEKDVVEWFGGFTWVVNAGLAYSPGASSNIEFLGEVGYRGAKLTKEDRTADMSGITFHAGVRYLVDSSSRY